MDSPELSERGKDHDRAKRRLDLAKSRARGLGIAFTPVSHARPLDKEIALAAPRDGDAIIFATAHAQDATWLTCDTCFGPGTTVVERIKAGPPVLSLPSGQLALSQALNRSASSAS